MTSILPPIITAVVTVIAFVAVCCLIEFSLRRVAGRPTPLISLPISAALVGVAIVVLVPLSIQLLPSPPNQATPAATIAPPAAHNPPEQTPIATLAVHPRQRLDDIFYLVLAAVGGGLVTWVAPKIYRRFRS
jgi:hypothetical protein